MSRYVKKQHLHKLLYSAKTSKHFYTFSKKPNCADYGNFRSAGFTSLPRNLLNRSSNGTLPVIARNPFQQCRSYYVDPRGYEHFQKRGFGSQFGPDRTRTYALVFISVSGLCVLVYATNQEVVPYTYRKHFVLISPELEVLLSQRQFDAIQKQFKASVLPPIHPQTVRVRRIAKDVIKAVMEGTKLEEETHLFGEGNKEKVMWDDQMISSQWEHRDEVIDEHWADETRKKGLKEGAKPFVEHLKALKWEVIVVDMDIVNAFCLPDGKVVVFTGLLKKFPSDAEVATVLGHEVGHVVARHGAEKMTRYLFVTLLQLFAFAFFNAPDLVRSVSTLFLELPFSRSQELEADHIGLLLMAAAGYDPRIAPSLYEKLGKLTGGSELLQYVTTHPSGSRRGERLKRTGTMEQAVQIYVEKTQGKSVEGFL